jgi:SagB-type dehydrogenase family enzyme
MFRKYLAVFAILISFGGIAFSARIIELPEPNKTSKYSLEEAIYRRRSTRSFYQKELSMEQISQILWAAQGITDQEFGFRAAPSAGSLYPLHIYFVNKEGVFRYIPDGHKMVQVLEGDVRASLTRAALGQTDISEAPTDIIIAANFAITQAKYGARAFRYVCMEIGHVAENIALQSVALGLASVTIGAFWDDVIKKDLNLPDNEDPLYIIPIGYERYEKQ